MITIIDYKTGNLGSIQNILKKAGEESLITSDKSLITAATKLMLPGVGSFDTGMKNLHDLDLIGVLHKKVKEEKIPVLGICLGMQLMTESSEEGKFPGLGWIRGSVKKFRPSDTEHYKVPHMGWNFIKNQKESRLFRDMFPQARFYFVHSYYFDAEDKNDILTSTTYESDFTSSFEHENILGVQFHPEKSHKFGMKLLKNYIELY